MKKILNIILYVIFLALLRLPGIMKDYMAVHMEFFPVRSLHSSRHCGPRHPDPSDPSQAAVSGSPAPGPAAANSLYHSHPRSVHLAVCPGQLPCAGSADGGCLYPHRPAGPQAPPHPAGGADLRLTFPAPSCTIDPASRPDSCGDKAKACS